jgi:hypothetical protein
MRPDAERLARGEPNPVPGASATSPVSATALLLAALIGLLVAVSYPTASAAVGATVLGVRYGARPLAGRLRRAARERDVRPVCMPGTDVCLEA